MHGVQDRLIWVVRDRRGAEARDVILDRRQCWIRQAGYNPLSGFVSTQPALSGPALTSSFRIMERHFLSRQMGLRNSVIILDLSPFLYLNIFNL